MGYYLSDFEEPLGRILSRGTAREPISKGQVVYRTGTTTSEPIGVALCDVAAVGGAVPILTKGIVTISAASIDEACGQWRRPTESERVEAEMNRDVRDERFMRAEGGGK